MQSITIGNDCFIGIKSIIAAGTYMTNGSSISVQSSSFDICDNYEQTRISKLNSNKSDDDCLKENLVCSINNNNNIKFLNEILSNIYHYV